MAWFMTLVSVLVWYGRIVGIRWLDSIKLVIVVILSQTLHVSCYTVLLHA